MKQQISTAIIEAINNVFGVVIEDIKLETPPKKELGDFAFGTFVLAKTLKKAPPIIAAELKAELEQNEIIDQAEVAGPYINIKISKDVFTKSFLDYSQKLKEKQYFSETGAGKTIVVDYIGANVGKPMHIGHMCTPQLGQTMIEVYKKLGYTVISDSHIGDWGIVFGKLIYAYKQWGSEEKLEENAVDHLLELYVKVTAESEKEGSTIDEETRKEFKELSQGNKESVAYWEHFTKYSIVAMNKQLARLKVHPDYNIGESFYEGLGLPKMENYPDLEYKMTDIVEELIEKGIATVNEDNSVGVEFDESLKIPSCILRKRDGTHGYLASDLAAIKYRVTNWNPDKIVYFVDVRQSLHFQQAFAIAKQVGWLQSTEIIHAANGFISLKDGAMSTRKGRIIKLEPLLDEAIKRSKDIILERGDNIPEEELQVLAEQIGVGAVKYGYLKKSRENDVIFDWDEFISFEGNSGPFIQYSGVRAKNILRKYDGNLDEEITASFSEDEEVHLVQHLLNYKKVLLDAAGKNMPHILCAYAYEITKSFNSFYNTVHILNEEDENKKLLRIKLVALYLEILTDVFACMGIDIPEKM